jgi:hypothetical protein
MADKQNSQKQPKTKLIANEVPTQQIGAVTTPSSTKNVQNLLTKRSHMEMQA